MPEARSDYLLSRWLDGQLTAAEQDEFEQACIDDESFASQVAMANQLAASAEDFDAGSVPTWDRDATFTDEPKVRWWQWQGLPTVSMACSVLALVLVVSGFRIEMSDDKIAFGFGHGPDQSQIAALVDAQVQTRIEDYQQANQTLLAQYMDALTDQQQASSAQLTEYLLTSSRQERREDFAELVKFINQQRSDDQYFYARQLNELQQEIYARDPLIGGNGQPINAVEDFNND